MSVELEFHPYANIFPMMTGKESEDHIADIKAHGLQDPIQMFEGKILDGRNRYRSCLAAGVQPRFEEFDGDDWAALTFVISRNLKRRNLTSSQSAACALKAEKFYAEIAKKRQQEGGRIGGVRSGESRNGESKLEELFPQASPGRMPQSRDRAANDFNTNPRYISDAKKIEQVSPETLEEVSRGEKTIPQAKRQLGLAKPKPENPSGQCRLNGNLVPDPPDIAKQRKKGLIPKDAIPDIDEPDDENAADALEAAQEDQTESEGRKEDLGDDDWLATLPVRQKLSGPCLKTFDEDALIWRRAESHRNTFAYHVARIVSKKRRDGAYSYQLQHFLKIDSPARWVLCAPTEAGGCGGTGQLPAIGRCAMCFGRGYRINGTH